MKRRDLRLLPLAAGVWSAALLCVFVPGWAWWVVVACLVLGCALAIAETRRPEAARSRGVSGLVMLLLAAMAAAAVTTALANPSRERVAEWSRSSDGVIVSRRTS